MRLAILFGSQATGRNNPISDLDVAVLFREDPDLLQVGVAVSALEGELATKVDLVVLNGLPARSPVLAREIAARGTPVLVRDEEAMRTSVRRRLLERIEQGKAGMRNYA